MTWARCKRREKIDWYQSLNGSYEVHYMRIAKGIQQSALGATGSFDKVILFGSRRDMQDRYRHTRSLTQTVHIARTLDILFSLTKPGLMIGLSLEKSRVFRLLLTFSSAAPPLELDRKIVGEASIVVAKVNHRTQQFLLIFLHASPFLPSSSVKHYTQRKRS